MVRRKKTPAPKPAEPKPEPKITHSNPLAPATGDEFHVVLTRSELLILIHTGAGSIQHFCSHDGINTAIAIQNIGERITQLASFLVANRPTLH